MECLKLTTTYLIRKLEVDGNAKTSIWNGKVFKPAWPDLVLTNPAATKAMLQVEYRRRANRVEKLRINLSIAYGLVLGQCTDYLRSCLERQEKWERMSNEQDLLGLLKIVKSLSHKYNEETEYHHVAYHTPSVAS